MRLVQALRLGSMPRLALVGAGGKTTALFQLARDDDDLCMKIGQMRALVF